MSDVLNVNLASIYQTTVGMFENWGTPEGNVRMRPGAAQSNAPLQPQSIDPRVPIDAQSQRHANDPPRNSHDRLDAPKRTYTREPASNGGAPSQGSKSSVQKKVSKPPPRPPQKAGTSRASGGNPNINPYTPLRYDVPGECQLKLTAGQVNVTPAPPRKQYGAPNPGRNAGGANGNGPAKINSVSSRGYASGSTQNQPWSDEHDDCAEAPTQSSRQPDSSRNGGDSAADRGGIPASRDRQMFASRQQAPPKKTGPPRQQSTNPRDKRKATEPPATSDQRRHVEIGEFENRELSTISEHENSSSSSDAYAQAAKKGKWEKQKNKFKNRKNPKADIPELRSAMEADVREVYAQKLDFSMCESYRAFEAMVDSYCKKRGVTPVDLSTIPNGNSRITAGCKVTVDARDFLTVLDKSFWPRGTFTREWYNKDDEDESEYESST